MKKHYDKDEIIITVILSIICVIVMNYTVIPALIHKTNGEHLAWVK